MATHSLVTELRAAAAAAEELGARDAARVWALAAEKAEAYFRGHALEALTLAQASEESGYSVSQISRLVSCGAIQNVGEKGAPRVTRESLPKKPQTSRTRSSTTDEPDLVGRAFRRHA